MIKPLDESVALQSVKSARKCFLMQAEFPLYPLKGKFPRILILANCLENYEVVVAGSLEFIKASGDIRLRIALDERHTVRLS